MACSDTSRFLGLLAAFFLSATTASSFGQTIAGEDFDSGTTNGGFTASSAALFQGDFDSSTFLPHDDTFNGLFDFGEGNFFDRFGTVNASIASPNDLPFDMVDDSDPLLGSFASDRFGVLSAGVDNNVIGFGDTLNASNIDSTGLVSGQWTFDISSGSNMQISIDFAAVGAFGNNDGGFETDDFITISYTIDGGASHTVFDVRPENSPGGPVTDVFYTVTMDSGDEYDRYRIPNAFFDEADWSQLTTSGPFGLVTFHSDDTDQDGFVELEGALVTESTRALTRDSFEKTEQEVFKNPLIVNGDATTGTVLNNNFQTVTVPIVGSGNTLTLKMLSVAGGSLEYSFFDNILIEEAAPGTLGDFDFDGDVDGADFLLWQRTDGSASGLAEWQSNYDSPVNPLGGQEVVPEPTSIGLVALAIVLVSTQHRRRRARSLAFGYNDR